MDFDIILQNCPAGYLFEKGTCNCHEISYNGLVKCNAKGRTIQNGAWIGTLSNDSNQNYYVGYSPYLSNQSVSLEYIYITLSRPCMQNRTGDLCADCSSGYAPSFNDATFVCVECHAWILLQLAHMVAGNVHPFDCSFYNCCSFHVNVTSGPVIFLYSCIQQNIPYLWTNM